MCAAKMWQHPLGFWSCIEHGVRIGKVTRWLWIALCVLGPILIGAIAVIGLARAGAN